MTTITVTPDAPLTVTLGVSERGPLSYVHPDIGWTALQADEGRWQRGATASTTRSPTTRWRFAASSPCASSTYSPSGAPVAAPTTSLPEHPGGIRNWDYRFAWPRDASIGVGTFLGTVQADEARRFLAWLLHASRLARRGFRCCSRSTAANPVPSTSYEDGPATRSTPVRVGNGAADQHQLDVYGWVLDAAWLFVAAGHRLYSETWRAMRGFADEVARSSTKPRRGHLGDPRPFRPPRALQAHGLARPRPRAADRRHTSNPYPAVPLDGAPQRDAILEDVKLPRLRPRARACPERTARPISTRLCSCCRCSRSTA